jgi:mannitol/fructose-specific phosphotransferase system IIA component (Ntr-type)
MIRSTFPFETGGRRARNISRDSAIDPAGRLTRIPQFTEQFTEEPEMNLRKVLSADTIALSLKAETKEGIIEEMIDLLMAAGKIRDAKDRKDALKAVIDRERKMSTGMQNGIAIPHGKTDKVDTLVAAIGLKKQGVDFASLDGQPSRIFVMTLSPDTRTGPHIQFLAEISRQLSDPAIRERIINAALAEDVITALAG